MDRKLSESPIQNYRKIYVAGKWMDKELIHTYIKQFEEKGYTITHDWTQIETGDVHTQEELAGFAAADIKGVVDADALVTIITDISYPYRGSCSELGAALATNKKVFVLNLANTHTGYHSNIFAKHALVSHYLDLSALLRDLQEDCESCITPLGLHTTCATCEAVACNACVMADSHYLEDWLETSNKCSTCKKYICASCVILCYDCANEGEDYNTYCDSCVPNDIQPVVCRHHTWFSCKKHASHECGTCRANHNYHLKHS